MTQKEINGQICKDIGYLLSIGANQTEALTDVQWEWLIKKADCFTRNYTGEDKKLFLDLWRVVEDYYKKKGCENGDRRSGSAGAGNR